MANNNNKTEKAISETGTTIFDGNLSVIINGKQYTVRCEYFGLDVKHTSQEHQVVMLLRHHLPYDEIDTGYIVRTKDYDRQHVFGLKAHKNDRTWSIYDYNDVIAWGYADGGLNNNHFNACRLRPEEFPQLVGNSDMPLPDEEPDRIERGGVTLRYDRETGETRYVAVVADDEPMTDNATDLMQDAAKAFYEFRKLHPQVTEIRFLTDDDITVK